MTAAELGQKALEVALAAGVGGGLSWLGATLRFRAVVVAEVAKSKAEAEAADRALRLQVEDLVEELAQLARELHDGQRQSTADHTIAARQGSDIVEVMKQCREMNALMHQVLGYLKATGVKL